MKKEKRHRTHPTKKQTENRNSEQVRDRHPSDCYTFLFLKSLNFKETASPQSQNLNLLKNQRKLGYSKRPARSTMSGEQRLTSKPYCFSPLASSFHVILRMNFSELFLISLALHHYQNTSHQNSIS